jgi:hypothetical protein
MPAKEVSLLDNLQGSFFTLLHDHDKYRHIEISKSDANSRELYNVITWPEHVSITSDRGCFVLSTDNDVLKSHDLLADPDNWVRYVIAGRPYQWGADKARSVVTSIFDEWSKGQVSASVIVKQRDRLESEVLAHSGDEAIFMQKVANWWPGAMGFELNKRLGSLSSTDLRTMSDEFIWSCHAIAWAVRQYKKHKDSDNPYNKQLNELTSVVMTRGQIESLYEQTPGDDDDQSYSVSLIRHCDGEKEGELELIAYDVEYPDEGYFSLDESASTSRKVTEETKHRVGHANDLIQVIAAHGRRLFFSRARNAFARFEADEDGSLWFVDDYTGQRISPFEQGKWKGFSHGGTLRELVKAMSDYILDGQRIPIIWIATPRSNPDNGDIWGYGTEASAAVRAAAEILPIIDNGRE